MPKAQVFSGLEACLGCFNAGLFQIWQERGKQKVRRKAGDNKMTWNLGSFFFKLKKNFFFGVFVFFLGPWLQHTEVPRLGVQSEL